MPYLVAYAFYYPPSSFNPNNIQLIEINNYTQLVHIAYSSNSLSPIGIAESFFGINTYDIYMTPEAYTNWFSNNQNNSVLLNSSNYSTLLSFYNTLINPVGGFSSQEALTQNYINAQGWYWTSYQQYIGTQSIIQSIGVVAGDIADVPSMLSMQQYTTLIGSSQTSQLYVLLSNTAGTQAVIGTPGVNPSSDQNPKSQSTNTNNNALLGNIFGIVPSWTWLVLGGAAVLIIIALALGMFRGGASTISTLESGRRSRKEANLAQSKAAKKGKEADLVQSRIERENEQTRHEKEMHKSKEEQEAKKKIVELK